MMMGNLNDEASNHDASRDEFVESEDGELYRLEIRDGKKVFTKPRHDSSKGNTKSGGKGRTDKECFRCGRIGHIRADCRAKTRIDGGPPKIFTQRKRCRKLRGRGARNITEVHWRPSIWGPSRCCQTTVMPKMMVKLMKFFEEATGIMPLPHLPLGPTIQRLQSAIKRMAGRFGNRTMETAETKSLHSSIVGIGSMSSLMFCNKWIRCHETHRSLYPVKKVAVQ